MRVCPLQDWIRPLNPSRWEQETGVAVVEGAACDGTLALGVGDARAGAAEPERSEAPRDQ